MHNFHRRLFKIKSYIRRFLGRKLVFFRPSFYPFLSGDGFRSIANFVHDELLTFDPRSVGHGDIIFVRNDFLTDFFISIHPRIKNQYVLISHNEDFGIDSGFVKYIDKKILHWFGQNFLFEHPKTTLLPIGLESERYSRKDYDLNTFIKLINNSKKENKKNRILFAFEYTERNLERKAAHQALSNSPLADRISKLDKLDYYEMLSRYCFIGAPTGAGIDCTRT